jgi:hypothetical protein
MTLLSCSWKGFFGRAFLYKCLDRFTAWHVYLCRSIWTPEVPVYPGVKIAQSFNHSKFQSEQLALALLDYGLFSEDYMKDFVPIAGSFPAGLKLLTDFWTSAASLGFDEVIRRLVVLGFPMATYMATLRTAATSGQLRVVETLLDHGAKLRVEDDPFESSLSQFFRSSSSPLIGCISRRSLYYEDKAQHQIAKLLIENGADVNFSYQCGDLKCHSTWDRYDEDNSNPWKAARQLQSLIDKSADVNFPTLCGGTPLTIAARGCDFRIVKLILQHSNDLNIPDESGRTLVHYAVEREDAFELLELLRDRDSDLEIRDENGYTPLLLAVRWNNMTAAKQLVSLGQICLQRAHRARALQPRRF